MFVLMGIAITPRLSFRLYPSGTGKTVYIDFGYYGASANAVEMEATSPLESVISTLEGIKNVSSVSSDGWGQITIEFEKHVNADKIRFRVLSAIREVYPRLPEGITYPTVSSFTSREQNMVQLLVYTISADMPPPQIKELVQEKLMSPISLIEGVSSVALYGANSNDWYIRYKPELMQQMGITVSQINDAIAREGFWADIGTYVSDNIVTPVAITGKGIESASIGNIEVANINGRIVTLHQIADITLQERDPNGYYRINGQTAINLVVQAEKNANQITTASRIYRLMDAAKAELPQSISVDKTFDSTTQLRTDLQKNILRTIISLAMLLLFVLVATRSLRYLLVVFISLVANLAISMLLYYALRLEIHIYSLSGITLSLGLIINNILVMTDHLLYRRRTKVFTALLAATLTSIGALVSIFFLEEQQQRNLADFAWVIIANLAVSLVVALLLVPKLMQQAKLGINPKRIKIRELRLKAKISHGYMRFAQLVARHKRIAIILGVLMVGLPVFLLPDKIEGTSRWAKMYNSTLGTTFYQTRIKPYSDKVLGGTLRLFHSSAWAKNSWGVPQRTRLCVQYNLPPGGTLPMSNNVMLLFEQHILANREVERTVATVHGKSGTIDIYFHPEHENGTFPYLLKSRLEQLANTQAAADFFIYGVGQGFSNSTSTSWANSQIVLTGYSHKQLMGWARIFADSLRLMPRVDKIWIKGGHSWSFSDEYRNFLDLNNELLLARGISPLEVATTLARHAPTSDRTTWRTIDGKVALLRLRPQGEIITDFALRNSPITIDNKMLRAQQVGTFRKELVNDEIYRENQQYVLMLAYNLIGPDKLINKVEEETTQKISRVLPVGFKAEQRRWGGWWDKSNKQQYLLIALMVFIIYLITAILFESLIKPIAVIASIPLSFVGVFITYWLFDLPFDQGTYATFLLLGGLVVNSAIYIVNEQANLMTLHPTLSPTHAYRRAINAKITPVLLTVLSTVLGLLPFMMFGEEPFWFSIAAGTIGGLVFSIPVVLVFLPAMGALPRNRKQRG